MAPQGGVSFAKSGTITWNPPQGTEEFQSCVSRTTPLYHYKLVFTQTLSSDVMLFYISGVPVPRAFGAYRFPIMTQDMLLLCGDMTGKKYSALNSAPQTNCVFNGENSTEIDFGQFGELTCGCSIYNQYGSSLYNIVMMFKHTETWKLAGEFPDWVKHQISDTIGCPAPQTLKATNLPGEVPEGLARNVVVWQGAEGVYISDGRAPIPIHGDIANYFDKRRTECISASLVGESVAFIDPMRMEYHLLIPAGPQRRGSTRSWSSTSSGGAGTRLTGARRNRSCAASRFATHQATRTRTGSSIRATCCVWSTGTTSTARISSTPSSSAIFPSWSPT
jgi:hypothetical protein